MNETYNNYHPREVKVEDDQDICVSELSPSAIRGAARMFELADDTAYNSVFN